MKLRLPALMTVIALSLTACGTAASTPSEAPAAVTSNCLAEAPTPSPEATPAPTVDVTAPPVPSAVPTPSAAPAPASGMEPPLVAFLNDQPVPEFLDEEQQELFLHAYSAATFLMGCSTGSVDDFPNWDGSELDAEIRNSYELVEVPGALFESWRYATAMGRYARWDDFKAMMDGLFTAEYQEEELLNSTWNDEVTAFPKFTSTEDGRLCYLELDRGSDIEYDYCDTPDSYELVSQSEDEIVFNLVGHYVHLGYDPATYAPVPQDEYTQSYPIRMELTDAGWRFSEFHLPY